MYWARRQARDRRGAHLVPDRHRDWGWGIEATAARLIELSSKANENGPDYAHLTARNAAAAVERRRHAGAKAVGAARLRT